MISSSTRVPKRKCCCSSSSNKSSSNNKCRAAVASVGVGAWRDCTHLFARQHAVLVLVGAAHQDAHLLLRRRVACLS